jgi:hypothetical protein
MVHEYDYNALSHNDRNFFNAAYESVKKDLDQKSTPKNEGDGGMLPRHLLE